MTAPSSGGALLTLTSSSTAFQVPASVWIPAGGTSATFSATAPLSSTAQFVAVTASYVGTFVQVMVPVAAAWIAEVDFGPGTYVPGDGSLGGAVSGGFASNGSGGYQGNFSFSANGNSAFPGFIFGFDNAQMAGDTLVVDKFTMGAGLATPAMTSQWGSSELPVTGATITMKIPNFKSGLQTLSGVLLVNYSAPVANQADPTKPNWISSVFSASFTAQGAVNMQ